MIRKEKERFRIRAVQMDNLIGLLGIRRQTEYGTHRLELSEVKKY